MPSIDDRDDCEDQALVPTERCRNWLCRDWQCRGPLLVKDRRGLWKCPHCGASYGKDAKGLKGGAAVPLEWSEPRPPTKDVCSYDHVVAQTPIGEIRLEWKSWKTTDSPCGEMPWGEFIIGTCLAEAKLEAQAAWDRMIQKLLPLCTQ